MAIRNRISSVLPALSLMLLATAARAEERYYGYNPPVGGQGSSGLGVLSLVGYKDRDRKSVV